MFKSRTFKEWGTQVAQSVELTILDLRLQKFQPHVGYRDYLGKI